MRNALLGVGRRYRYKVLMRGFIGLVSALLTNAAFADLVVHKCDPVAVAVFPKQRIHVKCSVGFDNGRIEYFALGVDNSAEADRVLSILSTALTTKRRLEIWFHDSHLSFGGKVGCQLTNCRLLYAVQIL